MNMTYKYICQEYFCEYKCGCIQPKPPEEAMNQSGLIFLLFQRIYKTIFVDKVPYTMKEIQEDRDTIINKYKQIEIKKSICYNKYVIRKVK